MGVIKGKRIIYLYRIAKEAKTNGAMAIAFTTENTRTKSKDSETVVTKDGVMRTPGEVENEISTTALFASENDEMIDKIEKSMDDDDLMEIWEVNLDMPGTEDNAGKYKAKYFQGYATEFELTSSGEEHAEAALTFGINGKGADGYATVTDEQKEIAEYVFKDTAKES